MQLFGSIAGNSLPASFPGLRENTPYFAGRSALLADDQFCRRTPAPKFGGDHEFGKGAKGDAFSRSMAEHRRIEHEIAKLKDDALDALFSDVHIKSIGVDEWLVEERLGFDPDLLKDKTRLKAELEALSQKLDAQIAARDHALGLGEDDPFATTGTWQTEMDTQAQLDEDLRRQQEADDEAERLRRQQQDDDDLLMMTSAAFLLDDGLF